MLFDDQMLDALNAEILPMDKNKHITVEDFHNNPLSLLEPYKNIGLKFSETENDNLLIKYQKNIYTVFGEKNGGLYVIDKHHHIKFISTTNGCVEFCNSSMNNFVIYYCYILSAVFKLKYIMLFEYLNMDAKFKKFSKKMSKFYKNLEGVAIEKTHWEIFRYEFEDGFFLFKPSLGYYIANNKIEFNFEE